MASEVLDANRDAGNFSDIIEPEITPFATNQNTHLNFATEEFILTSDSDAAWGETHIYDIPEKGQNSLLTNLKLQFVLPELSAPGDGTWINWVNSIGHALINTVKIETNNNVLDEHTGEFMEIWNELTVSPGDPYNSSIGKYRGGPPRNSTSIGARTVTVQLMFWFCKGATGRDNIDATKLAFPLGFLTGDNLKLTLKIHNKNKLIYTDGAVGTPDISLVSASGGCKLIAEYAFLDLTTDNELTRQSLVFYSNYRQQMTYIQRNSFNGTAVANTYRGTAISLNSFESSLTELIWYVQETRSAGAKRQKRFKFNYHGGNMLSECSVTISNYSLSGILPADNFTIVNPQAAGHLVPRKKIHVYSFALQPTIFSNPSGSFNISNKTGVKLKIKFSNFEGSYEGELYALGRRILIIQNGSCRVQDIA